MKHPLKSQAIDALLLARVLPVGRDRNKLGQLGMGLRELASIQEMQDWQSQTALVPGFVKSHQAPSRRGTIASHYAAVALPQDGSANVYRMRASGLRGLLSYLGAGDLVGCQKRVRARRFHVHGAPNTLWRCAIIPYSSPSTGGLGSFVRDVEKKRPDNTV